MLEKCIKLVADILKGKRQAYVSCFNNGKNTINDWTNEEKS
jgi:hypothetical protein